MCVCVREKDTHTHILKMSLISHLLWQSQEVTFDHSMKWYIFICLIIFWTNEEISLNCWCYIFILRYVLCACQGLMHLTGRPVAAFDPEGLIFGAGVNSESVKLYDLRSFDKVLPIGLILFRSALQYGIISTSNVSHW